MKEYFSVSYEQKKRDKLNEINEVYNKLISTYKSENDITKKANTANEIKQYNLYIMEELNNYLNLIESQITILNDKQNELTKLESKELINTQPVIDYTNDITVLENNIKKNKIIFISIIIISVVLLLLLFIPFK
jgi:hypothetical protein